MRLDDEANSYTELTVNGVSKGDYWNYGVEAWCNLPGRYVTISADLTSLVGDYEMSICNLGLFGTKYERSTLIEKSITLGKNESTRVFKVENIASKLTIGNQLDIYLR